MTMILVIIFLFGSIQCASSIKCYTCTESGYFCSLPLNLAGGEEHNENDIESVHYGSDYVCQSDHYIDPRTGQEKIILRGVQHCKQVDKINHRTYCCHRNNCNKELPPMIRQPFIYSNNQRYLPSMTVIVFFLIFLYSY